MTKQIALACALLAGLATAAVANDLAPDSVSRPDQSLRTKGTTDVRNGYNLRDVFDGLKSRQSYGQVPNVEKMTSQRASSS